MVDSTQDTTRIDDTRIGAARPLISPALLLDELPVTQSVQTLVEDSRAAIANILHGRDDHLVVVVGPCSIDDHDQAMDYARHLKTVADRLKDDLFIVMRVYFEKPRTTVGWLYQRSASGWQLPHLMKGCAARARASSRYQRTRSADEYGVSRSAEPAVHRGPDRVGRDRRAHDGEPESSATDVGAVVPDRFQERHRWRRTSCRRCDRRGAREPRLHGHDEDGHGRDLRNAQQRRSPIFAAARTARITMPKTSRQAALHWRNSANANR